jgi:hypothetical protein
MTVSSGRRMMCLDAVFHPSGLIKTGWRGYWFLSHPHSSRRKPTPPPWPRNALPPSGFVASGFKDKCHVSGEPPEPNGRVAVGATVVLASVVKPKSGLSTLNANGQGLDSA